jgi:hypothetical protein
MTPLLPLRDVETKSPGRVGAGDRPALPELGGEHVDGNAADVGRDLQGGADGNVVVAQDRVVVGDVGDGHVDQPTGDDRALRHRGNRWESGHRAADGECCECMFGTCHASAPRCWG